MNAINFLNNHPVFRYETFKEFMQRQGTTREASVRRLLNYYHRTGKIARVRRLLYVVTPETQRDQWHDPYLIASQATQEAILAYHTALEIHGLAYSTFEELTYLTNLPSHGFIFENQHYRPICQSKILIKKNQILHGIETLQRGNIAIRVTSLERTLVDVLDRPDLSGGWEEVMRSLDHLVTFDIQKIIDYVLLLNKAGLISKVGYFLEQLPKHLAVDTKYIDILLPRIPKQPYYMDASQKTKSKNRYIAKWKLIVSEYIADRKWEEPHADI
ncbi:MAG: transcriptional regulator [Proteobacteria bacterium]|nr:transcriptional regulator [Pseudomonadota bacterium]